MTTARHYGIPSKIRRPSAAKGVSAKQMAVPMHELKKRTTKIMTAPQGFLEDQKRKAEAQDFQRQARLAATTSATSSTSRSATTVNRPNGGQTSRAQQAPDPSSLEAREARLRALTSGRPPPANPVSTTAIPASTAARPDHLEPRAHLISTTTNTLPSSSAVPLPTTRPLKRPRESDCLNANPNPNTSNIDLDALSSPPPAKRERQAPYHVPSSSSHARPMFDPRDRIRTPGTRSGVGSGIGNTRNSSSTGG